MYQANSRQMMQKLKNTNEFREITVCGLESNSECKLTLAVTRSTSPSSSCTSFMVFWMSKSDGGEVSERSRVAISLRAACGSDCTKTLLSTSCPGTSTSSDTSILFIPARIWPSKRLAMNYLYAYPWPRMPLAGGCTNGHQNGVVMESCNLPKGTPSII